MDSFTMISLWIEFIGLLIGAIYFGKDAIAASGEDWEEFHIVHFTITVVASLAYLGMIMGQGALRSTDTTYFGLVI